MYIAVLVLKVCHGYPGACEEFGFSETGLFSFFVLFGFCQLLLNVFLALLQLYLHDHTPKLIRLARTYSISPSTLAWRVLARQLGVLRRLAHRCIRLILPQRSLFQMVTKRPFELWHRRARGCSGAVDAEQATGMPFDLRRSVDGELSIEGFYPRTRCLLVIDMDTLSLCWSWSPRDRVYIPLITEIAVDARSDGSGTVRLPHLTLAGERRELRISLEGAEAWVAGLRSLWAEVASRLPGPAASLWILSRMAAAAGHNKTLGGLPERRLLFAIGRANSTVEALVLSCCWNEAEGQRLLRPGMAGPNQRLELMYQRLQRLSAFGSSLRHLHRREATPALGDLSASTNSIRRRKELAAYSTELVSRALLLAQAADLPRWLLPSNGSLGTLQVSHVLLHGYTAQREIHLRPLLNGR